jgi:ATP-dependent RNA helicase DDX54/DBP10
VNADTAQQMNMQKKMQKWDRKKKKMVNVDNGKVAKIRTEHGTWIPASYKTDRYEKWKERTKIDEQVQRQQDSDDEDTGPIGEFV